MAGSRRSRRRTGSSRSTGSRSGTSTSPWRPPICWTRTARCRRTPISKPCSRTRLRGSWDATSRCAGRTRSGRLGRRRPWRQESGRARGSSSSGVSRASCACATAAGTWRPGRWVPPGLRRPLRHLRRLVRGRSRRSRDRTIRGAGISARRSSAPSPGGSAASPPRARCPERRGDPACPRPPGLGVQAPRLHRAPGPPRRPRSNPPPHQGEDISTLVYPRTFLLWFDRGGWDTGCTTSPRTVPWSPELVAAFGRVVATGALPVGRRVRASCEETAEMSPTARTSTPRSLLCVEM